MNKSQLRELAALAATCKPVTVIPEGVRAYSDHELRQLERGDMVVDRTAERHIAGEDHLGRSIIINGEGELIAVE